MPELPEVETIVRTLRPHVCHRSITSAHVLRTSSVHPLSLPLECLEGCRIADVVRRGKILKFVLDVSDAPKQSLCHGDGLYMLVHLRMTGRLLVRSRDTVPGQYVRCLFVLHGPEGATQLFFEAVRAFGQVFVCTSDILAQWSFWRELGPEPLQVSGEDFAARLMKKNAALKAVLLDQKFRAGVGNIYADESLFAARLNPRRKASSLTQEHSVRLLHCLRDVLRSAIKHCGSSIRDYCDANGNVGAFQNTFYVYGRAGQPCRCCGHTLQKLRVAGRSTVYCAVCQK